MPTPSRLTRAQKVRCVFLAITATTDSPTEVSDFSDSKDSTPTVKKA